VLKRLRWIVMGMSVGATASVWAQRKVKLLMRSYTPPAGAARAAKRGTEAAGRTAGEVRTAFAEGRQAMREREAELRHQIDQRQKQPPPL
jgi:hypothetical protein